MLDYQLSGTQKLRKKKKQSSAVTSKTETPNQFANHFHDEMKAFIDTLQIPAQYSEHIVVNQVYPDNDVIVNATNAINRIFDQWMTCTIVPTYSQLQITNFLVVAVAIENINVVQKILSLPIDVNPSVKNGGMVFANAEEVQHTALEQSITNNHVDIVKLLVGHPNIVALLK